jgi:hypothetical protein
LNILYLIGNGFDLNLGLNTKLSHVVENIIRGETDNLDILKLKENLKAHKELWWSDFELQLGQYTKEFNSETINAYDTQYNFFVKEIKDSFEKQQNRIDYENNKSFIATSFMKHIVAFYNYLPDTRKQVVINSMTKINLDEEIHYNFVNFNYTSVLDNFVKCCLFEYQKNKYSTPMPVKSQRAVFHNLRKIIHIHGTLEDGLILGVDNAEQIANEQLATNKSFMPRIIKLETIKALGRNSAIETRGLIDKSKIIIAFGLSIGITDKYWWNYIISWLNKNIDRHFILFIYDDKMDSTLNLTKLNTIENAKTKLFSVLDSSVQAIYNACIDRIHFIFEQKDMFRLENIFYPAIREVPHDIGSHNRYNFFQALKSINPKELAIVSQAVKNGTPEVIKRINDLMRGLP